MTGHVEVVRVSVLGDARVSYSVKRSFEKAGLTTRWVGAAPVEDRSAQQVAEWFGMYVLGAVVDESVGRPVRQSVRSTVDLVVVELRKRYPNLTIRIED